VATFAIVLHHQRAEATELARKAAAWFTGAGHEVVLPASDAEAADLGALALPDESLPPGVEAVVSLGGDGTMLRAVGLAAAAGIPILGVNVGLLGYLTEVEVDQLDAVLPRLAAGDYALDERMMLAVEVQRADGGREVLLGLNEAVVEKTEPGHTVRLLVSIDGTPFTTFAADGLIVATPTGSTAYSLSARGPIVSPRHKALVVTPVSPHMLFDRSLVLDPSEVVRLDVLGFRTATLSVDGRHLDTLVESDAVVIAPAAHAAKLVTFGGRRFHRILKAKFGLTDR
jgi:NAD+ kinase